MERRDEPNAPVGAVEEVTASFASGGLAIGGVLAGVGALVCIVLPTAGRMTPATGLTYAALMGILAFLLFFLHRRVEARTARRSPDAGFIPVTVVRAGNPMRQFFEGQAGGFLAVREDHLFVQLRHSHPEFLIFPLLLQLVVHLVPRGYGWLTLAGITTFVVLDLASHFRKDVRRYPWAEVPTVISCGTRVVVEFAAADGRQDLVLALKASDRDHLLPRLRERTRVEVEPEPPKPARVPKPPAPPRPPRPAPPPKTAIDGKTVETLDRALDAVKKARP